MARPALVVRAGPEPVLARAGELFVELAPGSGVLLRLVLQAVPESLEAGEDVATFAGELGAEPPTVTRPAVTAEQVAEYALPTAPQKSTDRRGDHMSETVQAEALSPDQLTAIVRAWSPSSTWPPWAPCAASPSASATNWSPR